MNVSAAATPAKANIIVATKIGKTFRFIMRSFFLRGIGGTNVTTRKNNANQKCLFFKWFRNSRRRRSPVFRGVALKKLTV